MRSNSNLFRAVETCGNLSNTDICLNLSECDRTVLNLSGIFDNKLAVTCLNPSKLSKLIQTCLDLAECVRTVANLPRLFCTNKLPIETY